MARSRSLPWRRLWDLVSDCSEQSDLGGMLRCMVRQIPRVVPCEHAAVVVTDSNGPGGRLRISLERNGVPPEAVGPYCSYYFYRDTARLSLGPRDEIFQVDWMSGAYGKGEFARDFIHGLMKIDMSAGIPIMDPDGRGGMCLIIARTGRDPLSAQEQSILRELRPALVNLYALHRRREALAPRGFCAAELAETGTLLSCREAEIASLLCRRLSVPEIAGALGISRRTVESHVQHIYVKLDVSSRKELVNVILRNGTDARQDDASHPRRPAGRLRRGSSEAPAPTSRTPPGTRPLSRNPVPPFSPR